MIRLIILKFVTYQGWKGAHTLVRDCYFEGDNRLYFSFTIWCLFKGEVSDSKLSQNFIVYPEVVIIHSKRVVL